MHVFFGNQYWLGEARRQASPSLAVWAAPKLQASVDPGEVGGPAEPGLAVLAKPILLTGRVLDHGSGRVAEVCWRTRRARMAVKSVSASTLLPQYRAMSLLTRERLLV